MHAYSAVPPYSVTTLAERLRERHRHRPHVNRHGYSVAAHFWQRDCESDDATGTRAKVLKVRSRAVAAPHTTAHNRHCTPVAHQISRMDHLLEPGVSVGGSQCDRSLTQQPPSRARRLAEISQRDMRDSDGTSETTRSYRKLKVRPTTTIRGDSP